VNQCVLSRRSFSTDDVAMYMFCLVWLIYVVFVVLCSAAIPVMLRAQTSHPLDPLSAAEISVAVATVRAAGATPEVITHAITSLSVKLFYKMI